MSSDLRESSPAGIMRRFSDEAKADMESFAATFYRGVLGEAEDLKRERAAAGGVRAVMGRGGVSEQTRTRATMPYALARAVRPILKTTQEYAEARAEKRAKAWLEAESMSLGYALAEVVKTHLKDLEP